MIESLSENWILVAVALVIGLAIAWWIWGAGDDSDQMGDITAQDTPPPLDRTAEAPKVEAAPDTDTRDELKVDNIAPAKRNAVPQKDTAPIPVPPPAGKGKPAIAAAVGEPDDLRKIKGVGPKLNTLLGSLGVSRYDQIAAWGEAEIAEVDKYLGNFKGRVARDNWVDQASYLAKNDIGGFEAKYGKMLK